MPSSYTSSARFTLQATGENNNTWGAILNAGVFQLVDDAVNGHLGLVMNGDHTLTTVNGATDEQRMSFFDVTGGTGGRLVLGAAPKHGTVRNNSTGVVFPTATVGGSQGVTFDPGDVGPVFSDGANVYGLQLGGLPLRDFISAQITGSGQLPSPSGNVNRVLQVENTALGPAWVPDYVSAASLAPGVAVSNIGYTPANKAGEVFTGGIQTPSIGFSGTRFQLYALGSGGGSSQIAWDTLAGTYETVDWTTGLWSMTIAGQTVFTLDTGGNAVFRGSLSAASIAGAVLANGSVTAAKLAPGAAVSNIGYTPANLAGDTFTGPVTVPSLNVKSTEFQLATDNASYSQINLRTSANYFLQYDWVAQTLKYVANGAQVFSISSVGAGVFAGTLTYHNSISAIGASATGIIHVYTVDGAVRWQVGVNSGTPDYVFNNYTAGGVYISTLLTLRLADNAVLVGASSALYANRNGQGVWWQNGSAIHLPGYEPGITFNHNNAGVKAVFGQQAAGRALAMAKGDTTPAVFLFDLNTGVGTATTWTSTSDRRLKFDLKPLTHGLEILANLTPFTFRQAVTEAEAKQKIGRAGAGLIAQDLLGTPLEVLLTPPADDGAGGETPYALDYMGLLGWMVAAFKEVKAELDDARARIEALETP